MELARAAVARTARRSARSSRLQRALVARLPVSVASFQMQHAFGRQQRGVSSSQGALMAKKSSAEPTEAMLAQQMLDFISLAEEEEKHPEAEKAQDQARHVDAAAQALLPLSGYVMDVKNNLASVSGLRHATIGSVVAVHDAAASDKGEEDAATPSGPPLCRGIVLFLEKKAAHVALFGSQSYSAVRIGMHVTLEGTQLEIPGSLARLSGAAVNPLGEPLSDLEFTRDGEGAEATANDRIPVAWGHKTVPGLMQRAPLSAPFETGILAIDCLKPLAFGHRVGVLGQHNSGKTRLALDVIAHSVRRALDNGEEPPHFVYVCVAKSAARVQQVVQFLEQTGALEYTTVVSADARDSLVMQYLAPFSGCAIAEYYMEHGKSHQSVVVYDDLAAHMMVVESLVQTMKLPKAAQLSLGAHAVLMERSAQFVDDDKSLTTLALADTPDSATGESSELKERMTSIVDDCIELDASLAGHRVYPPVNVLAPGASIRGPPFQSATLWAFMHKLRPKINEAAHTKTNVEVARKLGFEVEPEDAEQLEFLELVQQFFTQKMLAPAVSTLEKELGVFLLTIARIRRLPANLSLWGFIGDVVEALTDKPEYVDLCHQLETHPRDKPWSSDLQDSVAALLLDTLDAQRAEQRKQQKETLLQEIKRQQYHKQLRQNRKK